jgi:hypothetical protein
MSFTKHFLCLLVFQVIILPSLIASDEGSGKKEISQAGDSISEKISSIVKAAYPDDQKLILMRKMMETAKTIEQKRSILSAIGQVKTYTALMFESKYLGEHGLQQVAANAVVQIALSDNSWNGEAVKSLLNKASALLTGPENGKQRESISKHLASLPAGQGFVSMFNGKDLKGWKGLVENPVKRAAMNPKEAFEMQVIADGVMEQGWRAMDGILVFNGSGENLCTEKKYGDFEMLVDWKITPKGDAGIYLRGSPQVQIWDTSRREVGAQVGSGGLYNNQVNERNPLVVADNPVGEWNTFRIKMVDDRVTVYLNGQLVVDNTILENYWDRSIPIFPVEQIELQAHGTWVGYRDLYIRELNDK